MPKLQQLLPNFLRAGTACAFLALGIGSAPADVTFEGKAIDVFIASTAGGGTSGTTRLVGSMLERYLPGSPKMRYRHIPGGQGSKAINTFVSSKVKADGTTWIGGSVAHINPNALRRPGIEFDPTKLIYIGGITRGGSVILVRKERMGNLTDASKPPVIVGMLDGNRSWEQLVIWGKEYLGWNVTFVVGYPGTNFLTVAAQRGDTHMFGTANKNLLLASFRTGDFAPLVQLGGIVNGSSVALRSEFQNLPTINSLMKGKVSGLAAEAFEFWDSLNQIDKWFALPPGTPAEIVAVYRDAWSKLVEDFEFTLMGKEQFSTDLETVSGEKVTELVKKTAAPKPEIIAFIEQLRTKNVLPAEALSDQELKAIAKKKGPDKDTAK
jgi:hypothetical protein